MTCGQSMSRNDELNITFPSFAYYIKDEKCMKILFCKENEL